MASGSILHLGDRIYLYEEHCNGYFAVQGFADNQLGVNIPGSNAFAEGTHAPREFGQQHIFIIQPQQEHASAKRMHGFLEREGIAEHAARAEPRFRRFLEAYRREEVHNKQEVATANGRELRYGLIIELQHDLSGKRINSTHHPASLHKEGRRCEVDEPGDHSWFRIMPRLRVHTEGEKVHVGDPVILQHVVSGQKLFVASNSGTLSDGRYEVCLRPRALC